VPAAWKPDATLVGAGTCTAAGAASAPNRAAPRAIAAAETVSVRPPPVLNSDATCGAGGGGMDRCAAGSGGAAAAGESSSPSQ
jgi:hypothetical protein